MQIEIANFMALHDESSDSRILPENKKPKPGPKFTPAERVFLDDLIWELYTHRRLKLKAIAQILYDEHGYTLDLSTVSRILSKVSKQVARRMTEKVSAVKAEQTETLNHIANELLNAWELSKKPQTSVAQKKGTVDGTRIEETTTTTTVKEMIGDSRYLDSARAALEEIRDIWGIGRGEGDSFDGKVEVVVTRKEAAPYPKPPDDYRPPEDADSV